VTSLKRHGRLSRDLSKNIFLRNKHTKNAKVTHFLHVFIESLEQLIPANAVNAPAKSVADCEVMST
jgi:hypothetical protein